jgi:adenylate kinase family enzyme
LPELWGLARRSPVRALVTGGPGSGCTSTAAWIAERLGLVHFDSDSYFHKATEPPYQEQYSPEERRELMGRDLEAVSDWILSGSVATWGLGDLQLSHGVMLDVGSAVRLKRLSRRERERFGARIEVGGDLRAEHEDFMKWAEGYESRSERGRNLKTDLEFLRGSSAKVLEIREDLDFDETCGLVCEFFRSGMQGDALLR